MSDIAFNIEQKILKYIDDNWSLTSKQFADKELDISTLDVWIRTILRPADDYRLTITGNNETGQIHTGILYINVFGKPNQGSGLVTEYIDDLRDMFYEGKQITVSGNNKIEFNQPPDTNVDGIVEIDGILWWCETLKTKWEYLE